jgi:Flp pilus assembly protein TadD
MVLRILPDSPSLRTALLLLPLLAGCQSAPRPDALSLESRLRLAETLEGPQGAAAAVEVLREAARQRPQDGGLRERLALAAERAGRDGEAAQAMRDAIALQGPSLPRLLALGRLELRAGNTAAAAEAFAQANALSPASAAALGGLGLARDLDGDPAQAQEAYRAALVLAPRDWGIRANYALSLMLARQPQQAAEVLAEAEYAPEAPRRARHNLALALAGTGRPERAVRLLRLDMGPAEAEAMTQELTAVARRLDPLPLPSALPPVARQAAGREGRPPRLARAHTGVTREEMPPLPTVTRAEASEAPAPSMAEPPA